MADFIEVTRSELQTAPYSRVGIVIVTFPNSKQYSGSFSLVGRNDILTATHVVFNPELGGLATKLEFYLGAGYINIKWSNNMKCLSKVICVSFVCLTSLPALAQCRKSNVCDDYGQNCRAQDICDSTLDLPSTGLAPLTPLPSMELKPLPSMKLPPLGTSRCDYKQVNGRWQNVCQ